VPLGLLEMASSATHVAETADGGVRPPRLVTAVEPGEYLHVVQLPGVIWAAVRCELGNPWDVRAAIEGQAERLWFGGVLERVRDNKKTPGMNRR